MNNSRNAAIYTVLRELLYLFEYKLSTKTASGYSRKAFCGKRSRVIASDSVATNWLHRVM